MRVEELEKKDLEVKYKVTVSKADILKKIDEKAEEAAKSAKIDGFRAGKVPVSFIKSRYKDSLERDTLEFFVDSAVKDAVKSKKLTFASSPEVKDVHFKVGEDMTFTIEAELLPEIPDIDLKKVKLERKVVEVSEKEINDAVENLKSNHKTYKSLGDAHAAKMKDAVLITATGSMDGKEFPEGKVDSKYLVLGSKEFISGFEEGLVGAKKGERKTLNLSFPKDYWKKELSGKPVDFDVIVNDVCKVEVPTDEDLAKQLGLKDFKEVSEKVRGFISGRYAQSSDELQKKELFDHLDKEMDIQIPRKLLEKELEFLNKSSEKGDEKDKHLAIAKRRVKVGLILSDYAKKGEIKIAQEDINKEMMNLLSGIPAEQHNMVIDYYRKNPNALEHIRGKVLEDKAVESLFKSLDIKEKKVTLEELEKLFDK